MEASSTKARLKEQEKFLATLSKILKYEKELLDVDIKYNDSSYVKDFLEENESKIFEKQYKKFAINLRLLQNS